MTVNEELDQLYVYGIIPGSAEPPAQLVGVEESPVEVSRFDDLAVVVTPVDPDAEIGTPDNLLAHSTVLDAIAAEIPVLPMAFGTIVRPLRSFTRRS